jgi:hypothetical protein
MWKKPQLRGKTTNQCLLCVLGLALSLLWGGCNHRATKPAAREDNTINAVATGPLRILASNPHYFTDGSGKVIYLVGSHVWTNLQDKGVIDPPPAFDYRAYLDFLRSHHMNFFRLFQWILSNGGNATEEYEPYSGPSWPWQRIGPGIANDGKPKTDFTKLDQSYFDRMRQRIIQAGHEGIYVSVMLFNCFEFQFDLNPRDGNPFELGNNVNSINCGGTCPIDFNLARAAGVWGIEQAYIRKVIDTVDDLDNVLYEVGNEPSSPTSDVWQAEVIRYVKLYEGSKPKQHPVGINPGIGMSDASLYASEADWVSPADLIPYLNSTRKVIIADTDHSCSFKCLQEMGQAGQLYWAWANFASGNNLLFMDPYLVQWKDRNSPRGTCAGGQCTIVDPYWNDIRVAMGRIRVFAFKMNLAALMPHRELSSRGYCIANPGSEYLVYKPALGGWKSYLEWFHRSFTLNMLAGTYYYEWYNPSLGEATETGFIKVSNGRQHFKAPFNGDVVLYLRVR